MTLREALTVIESVNSIYNLSTDRYVYSSMTREPIREEDMDLIVDEIFADCGINIAVKNN